MKEFIAIVLGVMFVIALLFGTFWAIKAVKVWSREMDGKAALAEAEWSKKISIEEAKALQESAEYKAQAEIIRAKGVKVANEIIAEGLGGSEGYLRYLYINSLADLDTQLIYVPTEAGLPILEANRF